MTERATIKLKFEIRHIAIWQNYLKVQAFITIALRSNVCKRTASCSWSYCLCAYICLLFIYLDLSFQLLTSLNMCLVVGLAVDYVVHLAEGYTLSLHTDRYSRTRDMLEEMGPSVFSGACTTLGASLFMFAAEIQFFMQFGVFMFCTIGFSLIFSLGLFTLLVGLIGPQGNTGNLKVLFRKCKEKLLKRGSGKTSWQYSSIKN